MSFVGMGEASGRQYDAALFRGDLLVLIEKFRLASLNNVIQIQDKEQRPMQGLAVRVISTYLGMPVMVTTVLLNVFLNVHLPQAVGSGDERIDMRPSKLLKILMSQFADFAGFRVFEYWYVSADQHERELVHVIDQALEYRVCEQFICARPIGPIGDIQIKTIFDVRVNFRTRVALIRVPTRLELLDDLFAMTVTYGIVINPDEIVHEFSFAVDSVRNKKRLAASHD